MWLPSCCWQPALARLPQSVLSSLTMADPSSAIIAKWNSDEMPGTIQDVATWAGITGAFFSELVANLGCDEGDRGYGHYRAIAALTEEEEQEVFATLTIDGLGLTQIQLGKLRAFARAARVAAGVQMTTAQ